MSTLILLLAASLHAAPVIRTVKSSGGDHAATIVGLQAAVDHCRTLNQTDPCIVEIDAGLTITGSDPNCQIVLTAQENAVKPIIIRSSKIAELPPSDRVTAADASKLAKIDNTCTSSPGVIMVVPETTGTPGTAVASHYWLQGLEIYYSGEGRNAGGAVSIGLATNGSTKASAYWQAPHTITVDRCWIHGKDTATWVLASSNHGLQQAVRMDGRNISVLNSRMDHANMDQVDHSQGETKGVFSSNGPGPFYVFNNHIDGAIGSLLGGEWTWIPGLVSTGSWWYGNEYTRNVDAWDFLDWDTADTLQTGNPCTTGAFFRQMVSPSNKWKCVAGVWESSSDARLNRTWTKNGWECKNCRMAVVEGNYIHDIPVTGDQNQLAWAFLINQVDSQDGAYYARPEDIRIRFNRASRTGAGVVSGGWGAVDPIYKKINNITVEHNIFEGLDREEIDPAHGGAYPTGRGQGVQIASFSERWKNTHNTYLYGRAFGGYQFVLSDVDSGISGVDLRDNILAWNEYAQKPQNEANRACSVFVATLRGARYWDHNGYLDTNGRTDFASVFGGANCPSNVSLETTTAARFVDYNSGADGDYRLCTGSGTPHASCPGASPFATAASDGGPLGADAEQVSRMTAGAVSGTYDPGLFNMQIRAYSGNDLRYTPYHPRGACTVTVHKGNTQTHSHDDEGLIVGERTMTVSTSGAGEYVARITCKDAAGSVKGWREFGFKRYN